MLASGKLKNTRVTDAGLSQMQGLQIFQRCQRLQTAVRDSSSIKIQLLECGDFTESSHAGVGQSGIREVEVRQVV